MCITPLISHERYDGGGELYNFFQKSIMSYFTKSVIEVGFAIKKFRLN